MSAALFAEARTIAGRVASEEWVQGGTGAFPAPSGAGANASGMLGLLAANDLGWVVGQLGPLQAWMDGLDSDAGGVAGFAQSLQGASVGLIGAGERYSRGLADVSGMSGQTIRAYVAHGSGVAEALRVQGELVGAVVTGAQLASQLVQNVHGQVQDGVVEVAATALAVKTHSVLSGGQMSPAMMAQIAVKAAEVAGRVGPMVAQLMATLAFWGVLLRLLIEALKALGKWLGKVFSKGGKSAKAKPKDSGKSAIKGHKNRRRILLRSSTRRSTTSKRNRATLRRVRSQANGRVSMSAMVGLTKQRKTSTSSPKDSKLRLIVTALDTRNYRMGVP